MPRGRPSQGVYVYDPTHSRANPLGYVTSYQWRAERALGRPLPPKAVVHHVDGDRKHSANSNLVICEDQPYHMLLHRRARSLAACGHADWLKCWVCKQYDLPERLTAKPSHSWEHPACHRRYQQERKLRCPAA